MKHCACFLHCLNKINILFDFPGVSISAGLPHEVIVTPPCHHPHRFNEFAAKGEKWNGKLRLECVSGRHTLRKTPVDVLLWTCRSEWK